MSKQSGSVLIPVIVAILIALAVGAFLLSSDKNFSSYFKNSKSLAPATSTESLLKEEYSNPFDSSSSGSAQDSYQNPFSNSDYTNPFDAL